MLSFDQHSQARARYWFVILVIINLVLIGVLLAGAIVSYSMGPFEHNLNALGEKEFGGPDKPGRYVSSLPPVFRHAVYQLDADKERNLATLITAFNFLLLSYLCLHQAYAVKARARITAFIWLLISIGMMMVGFEEIFSLHSHIDNSDGVARQLGETPVSLEYELLLFFLPLAIGAVLLSILVLRSLSGSLKLRLVALSGLGLWTVALVIDLTAHGVPNHLYRIYSFAEETLEITGALILIFALFQSLVHEYSESRADSPLAEAGESIPAKSPSAG